MTSRPRSSSVLDAWLPDNTPAELRERVATMQRHAFEVQTAAAEPAEAEDPIEADPEALGRLEMRALVAVGELDIPDFLAGAEALAQRLRRARHVVIPGAAHLAPLEQPAAFRELLLGFVG